MATLELQRRIYVLRDEALTVAGELNRQAPYGGMSEEELVAVEQMQSIANGLATVERIVRDPGSFPRPAR